MIAVGNDLLQLRTPSHLGLVAPVLARPFQQVVREDDHGNVSENFLAEGFTTDPLLQESEWLHGGRGRHLWVEGVFGFRWSAFPGNDFAIDHRAIGQATDQVLQFGKPLGHQFFTP
ncbi:hypothetical protein D3C87_1158770 [compost metagenome]